MKQQRASACRRRISISGSHDCPGPSFPTSPLLLPIYRYHSSYNLENQETSILVADAYAPDQEKGHKPAPKMSPNVGLNCENIAIALVATLCLPILGVCNTYTNLQPNMSRIALKALPYREPYVPLVYLNNSTQDTHIHNSRSTQLAGTRVDR